MSPDQTPQPAPESTPVQPPAAPATPVAPAAPVPDAPVVPAETPTAKPKPVSNIPADERILAAAGYFPMFFMGALIFKPKSKFCQDHAKQGMLLTIITFFVLLMLVASPIFGSLLFLALVAAIGIGAFQAYSGNELKIPIFSQIATKIPTDTILGTPATKSAPKTEPTEPTTPTNPEPPKA